MKFFKEPKSMAEYYDDLATAVKSVRDTHKDADSDPAFKQAADVIDELVTLCRDMETVSALEARDINTQRRELMLQIGTDGLLDVKGEASKLLAQKYNELLQGLIDKKYWPVDSCPKLLGWFGPSLQSEYADNFEKRKPRLKESLLKIESRIAAYENKPRLAAGM